MSDPVTNVEIEDVLSSIRRLVSDESRHETAAPRPVNAAPALVLTQDHRVDGKSANPEPEPMPPSGSVPDGTTGAVVRSELERAIAELEAAMGIDAEDSVEMASGDETVPDLPQGNNARGAEGQGPLAEEQPADTPFSEASKIEVAEALKEARVETQSAHGAAPEQAKPPLEQKATPTEVAEDTARLEQQEAFNSEAKDVPELADLPSIVADKGNSTGANDEAENVAETTNEKLQNEVNSRDDEDTNLVASETEDKPVTPSIEVITSAKPDLPKPDKINDQRGSQERITMSPALEALRIVSDNAVSQSEEYDGDTNESIEIGAPTDLTEWEDADQDADEDDGDDFVEPQPPFDKSHDDPFPGSKQFKRAPEAAAPQQSFEDLVDEDLLRDMVADIVRKELQGELGERITRNVRKLVRREINRALAGQDLV